MASGGRGGTFSARARWRAASFPRALGGAPRGEGWCGKYKMNGVGHRWPVGRWGEGGADDTGRLCGGCGGCAIMRPGGIWGGKNTGAPNSESEPLLDGPNYTHQTRPPPLPGGIPPGGPAATSCCNLSICAHGRGAEGMGTRVPAGRKPGRKVSTLRQRRLFVEQAVSNRTESCFNL